MTPADVVLGATFAHARAFVLANPSKVPPGARLISASTPATRLGSLLIGRIVVAPGAELGPHYLDVHAALMRSASRYARPLT